METTKYLPVSKNCNEGYEFQELQSLAKNNMVNNNHRILFGNKLNKWYIIDKSDRDFNSAFTVAEFISYENENTAKGISQAPIFL